MSNDYMFAYYPTTSLVHKQNSTTKVIGFILLIIILFIPNLNFTIAVSIITLVSCIFSHVPLKNYIKINWTFRYLYILMIIVFAVFNLPLTICLETIFKIIILFTNLMLLTYTTSPIEISNGVENIIKPFNIFYLKIGKLALKICLLLKFIPICLNVTSNIMNSQSSRGFDYKYRTNIGKLVVITKSLPQIIRRSLLNKNIIKFNMETKLYNCNKVRTNFNSNKISSFDIIILATFIGLIIGYFVSLK